MRRTLLLLVLAACPAPTDETAAPVDDAPAQIPWLADGAPAVEPPQIPWLEAGAPPVAPPDWTCPEGWGVVEIPGEEATACEPFPEGLLDCARHEHQPPGSDACIAVGPTCPQGEWPEPDPSGRMLYVKAGATGGDGSIGAPFGTLAEAIAASPDGLGGDPMPILLAAGTHEASVEVDRLVAIRGACAERTVLTSSGCEAGAVLVTFDDVSVSGVTLTGDTCPGIDNRVGSLTVSGVAFDAIRGPAIRFMEGGSVRDVVARDTGPGGRGYGPGLRLESQSEVTAARVSVIGSVGESVSLIYGSALTGTDLVVSGQIAADAGGAGAAIGATSSELDLQRIVIQDNVGWGLYSQFDAPTQVRDFVIRRSLDDSSGGSGGGILGYRSPVELQRGLFQANASMAAWGIESTLTASDVFAVGNGAPEGGYASGAFIAGGDGGRVELVRIFTAGNGGYELRANPGAALVASDVRMGPGSGMAIDLLGDVHLRRADIGALRSTATLQGRGARLVLTDVRAVTQSLALDFDPDEGNHIELERVVFPGVVSLGSNKHTLAVADSILGGLTTSSPVGLTRSRLEGTSTARVNADLEMNDVVLQGLGLNILGGEATLSNVVVRDAIENALSVALLAEVTATDLAISGTQDCAECVDPVSVVVDGVIDVERAYVDASVAKSIEVRLGRATLTDVVADGIIHVGADGEIDGTRLNGTVQRE